MALEVHTLSVGSMSTNCYIIHDSSSGVIIDPGWDGSYISQIIQDLKIKPLMILLTHGHFDHVCGSLELKLNFNLPIFLNPKDLKIYKQSRNSAKHWLGLDPGPVPSPDYELFDQQIIQLGDNSLKVIATPGHTPGSVCFYDEVQSLFTGDTFFKDGVGRTDFSYSDPEELTQSLIKISALQSNTTIFPGHGESCSIAQRFA